MGSHGKSRRDRHKKKKKRRDESESYSCDFDGSDGLSPRSSSRRRPRPSDDSSDSDGGGKRSSCKKPSEEEIKEYMAKKAQKKALRAAKKLKTQSVSGYSNDSNPFGDSNLTETFVWGKKIEKDVHHGVPFDEFSVKAEKRRRGERMAEVEKVKKRREERAVEKARHQEEMALLARARARAEFQDEEEFHFDQARVRGEEEPPLAQERGLHAGVEADVRKLLDGKTHSELLELQLDIESQLRSGSAKVVEFWEAVLKRLHIYKAKACAEMLRRHLEQLSDAEEAFSPEPPIMEEEEAEAAGSFSPELMHGDDDLEEAIDPEEDKKLLEMKRMAVEDNFKVKAMKAMGAMEEGDAVFGSNAELNLDYSDEVYRWHYYKYRPRKPKYFNRVHTGYEWNKYNQTHYDHDNPPPKFVQGYKFNIFYPDLVDDDDKIKPPIYTIEKDGTSGETCMIRFHAGPPYQDIAFRIVNKEWELSRKKGFKCTFERGILHLYINFRRHRYRR